jgi:hypothetical protein
MTVTTAVVVLPRRMAIWAARRALARNSLTGIELGCSLCAAVWFSAGKPAAALAGGAALGGGYLARRVGGQLTVGSYAGWLAVSCGWAGELAVYAGLAVGAAGSPTVAWKLATATAMLFALRKVARLCRSAQAAAYPADRPAAQPAQRPGQPSAQWPGQDRTGTAASDPPRRVSLGLLAGQVLAVPVWARALIITGTAAYSGNRTALLVMTYCAAVALAWSLVAGPHRARPRARDGSPRGAAAPGETAAPGSTGGVAACRDDGPIARFAGALVHGQLVPLPPAVAGLIATVLLAALGLGSLAGLVLLTPVAAMLLAAPGSAHPHDGPLDWLAPVIIQAGQYIYLAALGFAIGIPGPVTFSLIGLVGLRQLNVAYQARHPVTPRGPRGSIGWEGRMLVAGFSAMVGLGTVGYLALIAYLGWLLCGDGLSGWFVARRRIAPSPVTRDLAVRR